MVSTSCHSWLYFCHIFFYHSLKNVFLAFLFWGMHPIALALNPRGKRFLKQKCRADGTTLICKSPVHFSSRSQRCFMHNCSWTHTYRFTSTFFLFFFLLFLSFFFFWNEVHNTAFIHSIIAYCTLFHRFIESLRLEKTLKIIESNHDPTILP